MADEFRALFKSVWSTAEFRRAPQRAALLKYLWENWDEPSQSETLWNDVLKEQSLKRQKQGLSKTELNQFNTDATVRQACLDLRRELCRHFSGKTSGWIIDLPESIPGQGYRLEFLRLNDPESPAAVFWQAHLQSPHPLYVGYTEQLFYQYWPERFAFRYFDLNAENKTLALKELKEQHSLMHREGMDVAYPYVSYGEIGGRDC